MAYPSLEQYNQAFQLHSKLLKDPELRTGVVTTTGLGLPLAISGGFALTYTIRTGTKKYAVRCFHRESKALEQRYQAIATRLAFLRSPYFLHFKYQRDGISVDSSTYPIVKMEWARGVTLGEFLEDNKSDAQALAKLSKSLESLAEFLEKEKIAHGDFQTGNLMVSDGGATVQLIDYDGMFIEEIRSLGSAELGHVNFQHPKRKVTNPFDPTLDRFSLISLWLSLKAIREDVSVWNRTNSEVDAIVFRANDFVDPESSPAFALLSAQKTLSADARNFAAICVSPMGKTPSLADFIAGRNIPVTAGEIRIAVRTSTGIPRAGYIGAYDVVSASDYDACLRRVGDKVEVIGRIIEVKENRTKRGKPYVFVNFGNWQGQIFKIAIWSDSLVLLHSKPDPSWVGKWVSVTGLMEPPYVSQKYRYSHLAITVTTVGQMTILTEVDAQWRLAGPRSAAQPDQSIDSNRTMLDRIKGKATSAPVAPPKSGSSNKAVLDRIRASSQPPPPQTQQPTLPQPRSQPRSQPRLPPPLQQQRRMPQPPLRTIRPMQHYSIQGVKPKEKGLIARILGWLFG
ncbi:BUD32 family EKC/KEOPS complex subunit [Burkholderia cepacia]|uniref:serine/threonine protein kinase n=1 Tax=Burkholderia cepacia TaxID=292 RepID=UPI002AB6918D|nr:serine/threonine protein kinase [Burkholderia cepacia]